MKAGYAWGGFNNIKFTGDSIPPYESAYVVSNHRTYADWLIIFTLAARKGRLGSSRFFAKDLVKWIPGMGWGLVINGSVFLNRDWMRDQNRISQTFETIRTRNLPVWLIAFPEGTRFSQAKMLQSQEYAKKEGLTPLQHVLIPRTKGFRATVQGLRDGCVDAVYDITIGYSNLQQPPSMLQMCAGLNNETIHIHITRFAIEALPLGEQALTNWCYQLFERKDKLLQHLVEKGHFPGPQLNEPFCVLPIRFDRPSKKTAAAKM